MHDGCALKHVPSQLIIHTPVVCDSGRPLRIQGPRTEKSTTLRSIAQNESRRRIRDHGILRFRGEDNEPRRNGCAEKITGAAAALAIDGDNKKAGVGGSQ